MKNLWQDGSGLAFDDGGSPTGYFWVHLLLAVTSFVLGTAVGGIGLRGVRATRAAEQRRGGPDGPGVAGEQGVAGERGEAGERAGEPARTPEVRR